MILDKQLLLADGQTGVTTSAASTNIYDAGAQGDAIGSHLWFVCRVKTTLTSGSQTATVQVALETADDDAFGTNKTVLIQTGAIAVASCVAGYVFVKALVPQGMRRYIRAYYTIASEALNAGAIDAFLVSDVDDILNY